MFVIMTYFFFEIISSNQNSNLIFDILSVISYCFYKIELPVA